MDAYYERARPRRVISRLTRAHPWCWAMHWRQWWWAQSRRKTSPSYYAIYQYHSRITSKNQPPLFYGRSNKHYHTNNKLQCYYHVVMMWGAQTRKWVRLKIYNRLKDREMVWQEGQNMTWSQRQQKDLARSLRVYIMNERLRVQILFKREILLFFAWGAPHVYKRDMRPLLLRVWINGTLILYFTLIYIYNYLL